MPAADGRSGPVVSHAPLKYRVILALAVVLYIALAFLASDLGFYYEYMRFLGVEAHSIIFVDMSMFSTAECVRLGYDIVFGNPCDPLNRPFNQSPFWFVLAVLPVTGSYNIYAGALIGVTFLGVLCWMLRPRSPGQTAFCVLALLSSSVMFAFERGNRDIITVLLVVGAALLLGRASWRRAAGYAVLILAGLLKFYPFVALVVAVEEKWRGFLAVAAASVGALAVFVFVAYHDLTIVLERLPQAASRDSFAATEIVNWLVSISRHYLGTDWHADDPALQGLRWGLLALSVTVSLIVWRRLAASGIRLSGPPVERCLFLAGAAMATFCFYFGHNISYRCIVLLPVVPLLLTGATQSGVGAGTRRLVGLLCAGILLILWANAFHFRVDPFFDKARWVAPWYAVWLIDEIVCWATTTVLLALVWQQVAASRLIESLAATPVAGIFRGAGGAAVLRPFPVSLAAALVVAGVVFGYQTTSQQARAGLVDVASLSFSAADPAAAYGSGWLAAESGPGGESARWAVGRRANLYLNLPRGRTSTLVLRVRPHPALERQRFIVFVNGSEIGVVDVPATEAVARLAIEIPSWAVDRDLSHVRFAFADSGPLSEGDPRNLALAFESLKVE